MRISFGGRIIDNKKLLFEDTSDLKYYYIDLADGATYKVDSYFIAEITYNICRLSFEKCDFNKRVEVDFETFK